MDVDFTPEILIVEDSPTQATIMRRTLKREGYSVTAAKNGKEAFELLLDETFDLIISDVEMPEMNGYELCQAIRRHPELNKLPFIIVTSLDNSEAIIKGVASGADNYLTKPFSEETLLNKVQYMLDHPQMERGIEKAEKVNINGQSFDIHMDKQHLLNFLLSTYHNVQSQNNQLLRMQRKLKKSNKQLEINRTELEELVHNMVPKPVAESLLAYGSADPQRHESVSVMFTDFVNFTKDAAEMSPDTLVATLERYFDYFDHVADKYGLDKIKTIGDSYMFAGNLNDDQPLHAVDCTLAALDILDFVQDQLDQSQESGNAWDIRIGINSGPVISGVIGSKRFAYDIWGPTVNVASRMESNGKPGSVMVSQETCLQLHDFFETELYGTYEGDDAQIPMYEVLQLKPDFNRLGGRSAINKNFQRKYKEVTRQLTG
ncbi:MAG: adenylate/guanylate cyclase domain-containing protein [Bacteroidota bacterium]